MKTFYKRITGLVLCLAMVGCLGPALKQKTTTPSPYPWPTQAWQTATPEQQGMDSGKLADLLAAVEASQTRLHSLLIIRNGYLVAEAYTSPYGPEIRHTIESNTKSIIGGLVGIAMAQGKIRDVDQSLSSLLPDKKMAHPDERKGAIRLGHLLSMTSGLDCEDGMPAANGMFQAKDWVQYLLDLKMVSAPGEKWAYCSGSAHLLSAILQQSTGMEARSYANQTIFQPLGIAPVEEKDWGSDPQGVTNGVAGLYLTPRELAKFGLLYLNQGRWDGQQVVPEEWVAASTREQTATGDDPYLEGWNRRFGYLFSVFPEQKFYGYLGRAGQEMFVFPEKQMVVVFTASLPVEKEPELLKLIRDYIEPAVQSEQALPANDPAYARLQTLVAEAAKETRQAVSLPPQMALQVSGKTYRLKPNLAGWKSMTFTFQAGTDEAGLTIDGPDQALKIGLDNVFRFSAVPQGRPVGLRGTWTAANEFRLEHMILGEFAESTAKIQFWDEQIKLSVSSLNFDYPPLVIQGTRQE